MIRLSANAFQRFGKNEISRAFLLVEPHNSEVCPTPALLDRHDAVVLYPRLEVTGRLPAFAKACKPLVHHIFRPPEKSVPSSTLRSFIAEWHGPPGGRASTTKSARELRQRGSNYRCCIPALAGFVSPQSIAPDGEQIFPQDRYRRNCVFIGQKDRRH